MVAGVQWGVEQRRKVLGNAAVDNAAPGDAANVLKTDGDNHPNNPKPLVTRDPAHCINLIAKDLGTAAFMKDAMTGIKVLVKLLSTDAIVGIFQKAVSTGKVDQWYKVTAKADTRFYGTYDEANSLLKNKNVLTVLPTLGTWKEYMESRPTARKKGP